MSLYWKFLIGSGSTGNQSDPNHRDIFVIHDQHRRRMVTIPYWPQEQTDLWVENYNKHNTKRNWWWVENVNEHIVTHSYYAPDMVMACVNAKHNAVLQLEKYIPGDKRQMFNRNAGLHNLSCVATKNSKVLSLRINNSK